MSIADIGQTEGLKLITNQLDEIYLRDPNTSAYMAFKESYSNKRDIGININNFLVNYEFLYQKLQKFGMTLVDGVQAFFQLNAVNLSMENEKLARTMYASLNYEMKKTFKKVFSDISSLEHKNVPVVKEEVEMIDFNCVKIAKKKNLIKEEME